MLPGTIDDLIAQRIEYHREFMDQEQIPVLKGKYHIAIRASSVAPRQLGELKESLVNKKVKFGNITDLNSAGIGAPSWSNQLLRDSRV